MIKYISIFLAICTLLGGIAKGAIWAGDQHYLTVSNFEQAIKKNSLENRLSSINDAIDYLTLKISYGKYTKLDKAQLNILIRKKNEILKRLSK